MPAALRAFNTIKDALVSKPVVVLTCSDRRYALISGVHVSSEENEGGMSASLCHIDTKGSLHVLAHDLQQLHSHEANYPPFWLEMANALH